MPADKLKHFVAGLLFGCLGLLHSPLAAYALPVLVGAAKEGWDRASGKGQPEVADAVWTWLGGLLPVVAWLAWLAT